MERLGSSLADSTIPQRLRSISTHELNRFRRRGIGRKYAYGEFNAPQYIGRRWLTIRSERTLTSPQADEVNSIICGSCRVSAPLLRGPVEGRPYFGRLHHLCILWRFSTPTEGVHGRTTYRCDRSTSCLVHSPNVYSIKFYQRYAYHFYPPTTKQSGPQRVVIPQSRQIDPLAYIYGKIRVENSHFGEHSVVAIHRLESHQVQGPPIAKST